jgi:ATP-dependent DNA ligase
MVVEITYLTWTEDGLLRHTVYQGVREDKQAREVVRQRQTRRDGGGSDQSTVRAGRLRASGIV